MGYGIKGVRKVYVHDIEVLMGGGRIIKNVGDALEVSSRVMTWPKAFLGGRENVVLCSKGTENFSDKFSPQFVEGIGKGNGAFTGKGGWVTFFVE